MNLQEYKKTIVILGPTASGKSDLAISLAKKYNGEIVSADSRQVYRGMDIGSGKVLKDISRISNIKYPCPSGRREISKNGKEKFYSEGIRHHLLDVASPKRSYNVTHFVRDAKKAIADIQKRGKTPIICGGTGFWAQALIEDTAFPNVKPNTQLRKKLEKYPTEKLFAILEKKDPRRAETIDRHNKVRLIRALEIVSALGKVPISHQSSLINHHDFYIIALNPDKEALQKNIEIRLKQRLKKGMVNEVEKLRASGISWKRLESFGLEYKNVALFLQKKISRQTMRENILREIFQYAKRQLTWLRRFEKMGAQIHWVDTPQEAIKIIRPFAK